MSDDLNWPREIWMAEREEHDQGVVTAVLSEWGTVPRWEGDKERDREFHRYVDADIHESADKYWRARIATLEAQLAQARADGMREAAGVVECRWAYRTCREVADAILAAIEKGEG
ncbi:hypothetical protein PVW46_13275 [Mameliella sp. AT18]|uniref:hypothetical protein n=1 Tax=Mameliella sp. AT18 TaxID=3028385 RepID=UPI0008410FBF|nr:hypothetical protein [Mameliella sp. AT18]MDD9730883.1 hypothetical protein [Mameliella sp. AT18]ODM47238.1 hypothetical protein A9320_23265 [Ruegeria sp. PBVC088]